MAGQHGSVPVGKQPEMGKATVRECFCVSGTLCMLTASLLTVNLLFLLQMRKLSQSEAMTFSGDLAGKWYQDTILGFLSGGFTFLTTALYCFSAEQGPKGGQCRAEEPSISWLRQTQQTSMGFLVAGLSSRQGEGDSWGLEQHEPHPVETECWVDGGRNAHTGARQEAVTRIR